MASPAPVVRNVQDELLKTRRSRRSSGDVPYPLKYTKTMMDFDIWDHFYFVNTYRGLTAHRFEKPPVSVLDLGCGGGYWALEAAKQWPTSKIIGFDVLPLQPHLDQKLSHHQHLSDRLNWITGNFLDGLPFDDSHFDFVRMSYIGLGVPEDEWQFVFEAVSRVMKPNAILEVIEEDLIFPCTNVPPDLLRAPTMNPSRVSLGVSSASSHTDTVSSKPPSSPLRSKLTIRSKGKSSHTSILPERSSASRATPFIIADDEDDALPLPKHPQDHSRLKASWEAMLAKRFFSSRLLSVLPFYISTFFDVLPHYPPTKIPLPSNSALQSLRSSQSTESFRRGSFLGTRGDGFTVRPMQSMNNLSIYRPSTPSWESMHLSKTVNTISACQEQIWIEYQELHKEDHENHYAPDSPITLRKVFDRDWEHWIGDMRDRMSMSERLGATLLWPELLKEKKFEFMPPPGQWRGLFVAGSHLKRGTLPARMYPTDPNELCRSMRVFVSRKKAA
ncbi:hypothetical protein BKA70DRAFT_226473 [Coprinopsis sp. MPI-PUGE-AT-0042]|nr:hypothetical protein BKA70DRAFT_226473 [Coprinopsis sp. MPI-PUGE-AT-0042]